MEHEYFGGRAKLVSNVKHIDKRGVLMPFSFDHMPFVPCRCFVVHDTPAGAVRGGHAHRFGTQMLICLSGCIEISMRFKAEKAALTLKPGSHALVFDPGVWCQQKYKIKNSVLLVFASDPYNPNSYTEDWNFISER